MVMEAEPIADRSKRPEEMRSARPLAGGAVLREETSPYPPPPPSTLALTPAPECRKLSRGISRATDNEGLVWALRSAGDGDPPEPQLSSHHIFLLPDVSVYPDEFRNFVERDLLETAALVTLETAGRLNWWCGGGGAERLPRLLPLATSGDGNCLPHAASLAAWGFHDRLLALRTRVKAVLAGEEGAQLAAALRRRWRWSEAAALSSAGLTPTEAEWECEWAGAVAAAGAEPPARDPAPGAAPHYHGLDQLHVLALAHVMRRPVIVFADVVLRDFRGEPIAPIPFGGIYLPLELEPRHCSRAPVLLAYDAGHFSALVPGEPLPAGGARVPLEDAAGEPLPLRFVVDPGERYPWGRPCDQAALNALLPDELQRSEMLAAYLDVERVECEAATQPPPELRRSLDALSAGGARHSVAKQFGSIGRSVGHRIKKNLGSMARLAGRGGGGGGGGGGGAAEAAARGGACEVLCCRVLAARAPVQEEMVQNYLEDAWQRFTSQPSKKSLPVAPRYGTGRSQFYAEADRAAHEAARNMAARDAAAPPDRTLYLCRSTFYDDRPRDDAAAAPAPPAAPPAAPRPCRAPLCMFYGSAENDDYCSRCARLQ